MIEQIGPANDAGIVDEDIDAAKRGDDRADDRLGVEFLGEVNFERVKTAAGLADGFGCFGHGAGAESGDIGACAGERQCHALAKARSCAGDQRHLA